jgi:hypothetical protein
MNKKKIPLQYIKNFLKYIIIGIIVAISCRYIPTINIQNIEILIISFISSITFSLLDMISPNIKN